MDLTLHLDRQSPRTLSQQVANGVRHLVEEGVLVPGEALPSSRELARSLGVGRNTVIAAYEQLTDSGHVSVAARRRPIVNDGLSSGGITGAEGIGLDAAGLPGKALAERFGPAYDLGPELRWDFRVGTPDVGIFPHRAWLRAYRQALYDAPLLYSHDPRGSERLRSAVAVHLVRSRGMKAEAGDIVITTGTQQALSLVTRFLMRAGDTVLMEDPGYLTARRLFQSLGARVLPVPVDESGLVTGDLPPARLAYATPSHQFPLGGVLPLARRQELLLWASQYGAYILEDDYDGEFRFGLPPLPALQRLDREGRAFYIGTFSKILAPGLRLGFVVAPPRLSLSLAEYRALTERPPDGVSQEALATFIETGGFDAHLRRMRRLYAERREAVRRILEHNLPPQWRILGSAAGLHIPVLYEGSGAIDLESVTAKLRTDGIVVETLRPYSLAAAPTGVVLGYGPLSPEAIETGLARFCQALRALPP
jgi:GntR family transcriptional regulator/MocR family aminotransferase